MINHATHTSHTATLRHAFLTALLCCALLILSSPACAAKVLIIGDLHFAFVANAANDIRATLRTQTSEYAVADIRGKLNSVVEREGAQVVVALGTEAVAEALRLPSDISVVYGLVIVPPRSGRANVTGVYLSPPAGEYISTLRRYFPALGRVSVIGTPAMIRSLGGGQYAEVSTHQVASSVELINSVGKLGEADALLLLPDVNLLTASAMENVYAFSFRKNIPLLGISEGNVKQGSLFALVFDAKTVSRQIGAKVQSILNGEDADDMPASPPGNYNLFLNTNTARKMGISIPAEMLNKAKKAYP